MPLNYHSGQGQNRDILRQNLPPTDVITRKSNSPRREMGLEGRRGTQTALSSDTDKTLGDLLTSNFGKALCQKKGKITAQKRQ